MEPHGFDIDIVAGCNLRCPSCPQGNMRDAERPRGLMSLDTFKEIVAKIARENPVVNYIGLYSWTEPLLHPQVGDFIRVIKDYGYRCLLSSNFNRIEHLEDVLRARPDVLHLSMSGFYPETYKRTHKNGDIEKVKANMRELRRLMDRLDSQTHIVVVYHMYKDNLGDDLAGIQALCQELRFSINPVWAYLMPVEKIIDYHEDRLPKKDMEVIDLFAVTPHEAKDISLRHNQPDCEIRRNRTAINSDGSVALCCGVFDRKYVISENFLEKPQTELQRAKYQHELCKTCMSHAIHVTGGHAGIEEWNAIGLARAQQSVQKTAPIVPPIAAFQEKPVAKSKADITLYPEKPQTKPATTASSTRRPKLSVLIPTYNRADYLRECVESVMATTVDCEILVLDNASPDRTPEVLAELCARDSRIRVIRHDRNRGSWVNTAMAMREARGETLCLLGDDDSVLPGNFEKKLALLDAHPEIGLVYSTWHRIDERSQSLGVCRWPGLVDYSYIGGRNDFADQLPAGYIMHQAVVFRRELWEQCGGFEGWRVENGTPRWYKVWERPEIADEIEDLQGSHTDWDMLLRFCYHAKTAYINEPLANVRVHANSNTQNLGKAHGMFAEGRLAVWRKWLVDSDNPPVLDDSVWLRMQQAFVPDLQWEFGGDTQKIQHYVNSVQQIRQESLRKIERRFHALTVMPPEKPAATLSQDMTQAIVGSVPASFTRPAFVWNAPLFDPSGYAEEARNFLLALDEAGHTIAAQPIRWSERIAVLSAKEEARLRAMTRQTPQAGSIHVSHIFPPHFTRRADAHLNVGRTMFETDRLPQDWVAPCNQMDQVWVPSEFNRETFAKAGVEPDRLVVVPGAIDMTPYDPTLNPLPIEGRRGYNFLSIFDWSLRKGWDTLLRAYIEEFRAEEEVALILKTHSSLGYTTQQISDFIVNFLQNELGRDPESVPDIVLQATDIPAHFMPNLYRTADCFVLPTRGEGWGRPYMEAMAMGLPTIGTDWSGNTAFMNAENSYLLDYTLVPVPEAACREAETFRGHQWAEPDGTHLRRLMRQVFTERAEAKAKGAFARQDIAERFSYRRIAALIEETVAQQALPLAA